MNIKTSKVNSRRLQSWFFGFGIFVGILLIVIAVLASIKITKYATYTNANLGIRLQFPANWRVINRPAGGALVVFLTPKSTDLDTFIENVNISVKDMSATPMTPMEFSKLTIKQLTGTFDGYISVLEARPITISHRPAYKFVYMGDVAPDKLESAEAELGKKLDTSNPLKYQYAWVLKDNRAYIITYVGQKSEFDKYVHQVNSLIDSFQFL